MNASTISTAELRRLERLYAKPSTLNESLILRGIQAELADPERRAGVTDPIQHAATEPLRQEIEDLEEELDDEREYNAAPEPATTQSADAKG